MAESVVRPLILEKALVLIKTFTLCPDYCHRSTVENLPPENSGKQKGWMDRRTEKAVDCRRDEKEVKKRKKEIHKTILEKRLKCLRESQLICLLVRASTRTKGLEKA